MASMPGLSYRRYLQDIAQSRIPPPPPSGPKVAFIPYDLAPRPKTVIRPIYPEIAQEAGIEGVVVVQAFIDERGHVKETLILKGVPNTGLDEAAMEAIRRTKFHPAEQRERPVGVWISIPVNFRLK
jgi:protein TonB